MQPRRIAAVLVTCLGVAAAAAILGGWRSSTTGGTGTTAADRAPTVVLDHPRPTVADDVRVYGAALTDWQPKGTIHVYKRFCFQAEPCTSRPVPQRIRDGLAATLHGRVSFVDSPVRSITLDPAEVSGSTARLRLQEGCGRMCVEGEGIHLTKSGATWRITGTRLTWIS